jgi:hypothetical protein
MVSLESLHDRMQSAVNRLVCILNEVLGRRVVDLTRRIYWQNHNNSERLLCHNGPLDSVVNS